MDETDHDPADDDRTTADAGTPLDAGVAQFQQAALDAVKAARAMLDAAESVIREPAAIEAVVQTVTALARSATESVAEYAAGAARSTHGRTATEADDAGPDDGTERDDAPSGVERIRVD